MFSDGRFFIAFLPAVYGTALLIGAPTHMLLQSRNRRDLGAYLAVTTVAALAAVTALTIASHVISDLENPFRLTVGTMWSVTGMSLTLTFLIGACITASVFWWIAVRARSA
jgi:hypothetical protein